MNSIKPIKEYVVKALPFKKQYIDPNDIDLEMLEKAHKIMATDTFFYSLKFIMKLRIEKRNFLTKVLLYK